MNNEFISYEQALALKELGFDEPCLGRFYTKPKSKMFGIDEKGRNYPIKNTYKKLYTLGEDFVLNDDNVINAPLYQQVFRWFREKYNLYSFVFVFDQGFGYETYKEGVIQTNESFESYDEAEIACLDKLIELVKNK
jgi:hypothetical protein